MIKVNSVLLSPDSDNFENVKNAALLKAHIAIDECSEIEIFKRSIDARKKSDIKINYSVIIKCSDKKVKLRALKQKDVSEYTPPVFNFSLCENKNLKIIICGMGPAGLFCAYVLAKNGFSPIVLERGSKMEERTAIVESFFKNGILDENSNIQFGEGGAGTFSDGKLNTGVSSPLLKYVSSVLIKHGAPPETAYFAKAHIGTDMLRNVVVNIRNELIRMGAVIHFNTRLENLVINNGAISGVIAKKGSQMLELECDKLVIAAGHSARDTFEMLKENGLDMCAKPFAAGLRAEHPQSFIDRAMYGNFAGHDRLGAASYKIWTHLKNGRGVYSFCMCPGGVVVGAASEKGGVVTNGMSFHARNGSNANSALLCDIRPDDFQSDDPLAGMYFQRMWEQQAFKIAGGGYKAPVSLMGDFISGKISSEIGSIYPTYKPGFTLCDLRECIPQFVSESLRQGILDFDKKIKGFNMYDAVLTGVETRSSSPVRIIRDESLQSNIKGIYPCGEGAGYAGGIMSAAADGVKVACAIR